MAQQRALPQSKETLLQSYNKRLKDDVKSIMDNFTEIIKTAKVGALLSPAAAETTRRSGGAEIADGCGWRGLGPLLSTHPLNMGAPCQAVGTQQ